MCTENAGTATDCERKRGEHRVLRVWPENLILTIRRIALEIILNDPPLYEARKSTRVYELA